MEKQKNCAVKDSSKKRKNRGKNSGGRKERGGERGFNYYLLKLIENSKKKQWVKKNYFENSPECNPFLKLGRSECQTRKKIISFVCPFYETENEKKNVVNGKKRCPFLFSLCEYYFLAEEYPKPLKETFFCIFFYIFSFL